MVCSPGEVDIPRKPKKRRGNWVWTTPALGSIKINVDESYLRSLVKGGYR